MTSSDYKLIPDAFTAIPSLAVSRSVTVRAVDTVGEELDAIGYTIGPDGTVPTALRLDGAALARAGFTGKLGETLLVPTSDGPEIFAVGTGDPAELTATTLRDVAASFARAARASARIGLVVSAVGSAGDAASAGGAIAEGILLARYAYTALQSKPTAIALASVEIAVAGASVAELTTGVDRGVVAARGANIARDLANTPPSHLTATNLADIAEQLGAEFGFAVESFDRAQLIEMRCGGLLGVNAGSAEEPRMIKLVYTPAEANGRHVAFVGKGIMYDSGGISLKPSDPMHLLMKMDMGGAAAVLGAVSSLAALDCPTQVTAFLSCTDNMPSSTAYKLGDVLTARNGTTIEVKNTDAEGRLVMSDALVLAAEEKPDAIVDIATLTGAALMALGGATAALLGTDDTVIAGVKAAAATSGEQVWQLPLEKSYRKQLDSDIADIANLGGPHAGATTAALFLAEFVDGIPWAHLDIAGTMQSSTDDSWRPKGATGFGARLLADFAMSYGSE